MQSVWQSSSVQSVRRKGERAVWDWLWSEVELGFSFSPPQFCAARTFLCFLAQLWVAQSSLSEGWTG